MNPDILYEDDAIIVCIKPAGIPTQSASIQTPDMESLLKNHVTRTSGTSGSPYLAVIHRLDQPVEGILVFAKTSAAAKNLSKQLTDGQFLKIYYAVLSERPTQPQNRLEHYLIKDARTNTSRVCSKDTDGSKKAILDYKILSPGAPACLAEITLQTGRHHQIRVQLSSIGCPLVGDRKYGSGNALSDNFKTPALSARRLCFRHPTTHKPLDFHYTPKFAIPYL